MKTHHPYKDGYSVLPKLNKITGPFFEVSEDRDWYLSEKYNAVKHQVFYLEHNLPPQVQQAAVKFIREQYPLNLPESFGALMMEIQEDVLVHMIDEKSDWVAAGHVCFPSGWQLEKKVGTSFEAVHKPVPGMNLSTSRKMVEAMVNHGPFERFVWSVIFDKQINGHPSRPKKPFDPQNPEVWVKVERQLTYGLPDFNASLFILRQHLIPEVDIDKPALAAALKGMSEREIEYKGLKNNINPLLDYLSMP